MRKNLQWHNQNFYMGKVFVGNVTYSPFVSREDPKKYAAYSCLPSKGSAVRLGHFEKETEAMEAVEKYVNNWLDRASL